MVIRDLYRRYLKFARFVMDNTCTLAANVYMKTDYYLMICIVGLVTCALTGALVSPKYGKDDDVTIVKSLNSQWFNDSLVTGLSVTSLIILEIVIDLVISSRMGKFHNADGTLVHAVLVVGSFFLTSAIIIFYCVPNSDYLLYNGISNGRIIAMTTITISFARQNDKKFWDNIIFKIVSPIGMFGCIFESFEDESIRTIGSAFEIVASVTFFIQYIRWMTYLHRTSKNRTISNDEYKCAAITTICVVTLLAIWGVSSNRAGVSTYTRGQIVGVEISFTAFVVFLSLHQVHVRRNEVVSSKMELEFKRMFVRYISHEVRTPLNTAIMGLQVIVDEINRRNNFYEKRHLETISDIQISCNIAVNVLNELLTFDKLEAGTLMIEKSELFVMELIEETIQPFGMQAQQKRIQLAVQAVGNDKTFIRALKLDLDRNKVAQVIRNLVSNALKFTPDKGKVDINISTVEGHKFKMPYSKVFRLDVVDTGAGISLVRPSIPSYLPPPGDQKKLFKEIVQFHPGKLQAGGGSGLGLYISYGIVKLHDGILSVHSDGEGLGSTFTMILPIIDTSHGMSISRFSSARSIISPLIMRPKKVHNKYTTTTGFQIIDTNQNQAPSSLRLNHHSIYITNEISDRGKVIPSPVANKVESFDPGLEDDSKSASNSNSNSLRVPMIKSVSARSDWSDMQNNFANLRVLIADDNGISRKMQQRLLKHRVLFITDVPNGLEAVREVTSAEKPFDLVLMDSMMPVMDGLEATKRLRDFGFKGIIVGVTGNVTAEDIEMFMSRGADAVLPKPLDIHNLEVALSSLLAKAAEYNQ